MKVTSQFKIVDTIVEQLQVLDDFISMLSKNAHSFVFYLYALYHRLRV